MATKSVVEQRTHECLRALDALGRIAMLMDAAMGLTTNANERRVQAELLGVIYNIANTLTEEKPCN